MHRTAAIAAALAWALLAGAAMPGADAALPEVAAERHELHGRWRGERFWARLMPADRAFGGRRVLQLVYEPPKPDEVDGAHLVDCPFLLLDKHARVIAWNGRDGLSLVHPHRAADGYLVQRELHDGKDPAPLAAERAIAGEAGWDLHLAPLLLALAWRPESSARVRVVDLFGARHEEELEARWQGGEATVAGATWRIEADDQGRARRIADEKGTEILLVEGRGEAAP